MCCTWLAENTGRKSDAKNCHLGTIPQHCWAISSQLRHVSTIGKNISSTCPHNMMNFSLLVAEIVSGVWGTQLLSTASASWQRYCTAVKQCQTLRRWTEGTTYVWQGGHHVGHWPTFLVLVYFACCFRCITAVALQSNVLLTGENGVTSYVRISVESSVLNWIRSCNKFAKRIEEYLEYSNRERVKYGVLDGADVR